MRLGILATAISLSLVGLSIADNVHAAIKKETYIPAQGLGPALQAFARDRNLQIVYVSEEVNDLRTRGVAGDVTPDEALTQLLDGTNLSYRYLDEKTVTVFLSGGGAGASDRGSQKNENSSVEDHRPKDLEPKASFWQRLRLAQTDESSPSSSAPSKRSATAQENQNRVELEEIVVTGTHLRYVEPITPVITITRDDLIKQGYTRLDQALQQLPQNFKAAVAQDSSGITSAGANASNNYSFSSGVNLRGLGPTATLVLLNGRRLAPTATGQSVDISQIPISVIERVEVLTDGASATYGSDAVAGVVNIITRKSFSGVETGVRATSIADGKDPNYGGSVTGGIDWSTGAAVLNIDYEKDKPLLTSDRSFTSSYGGGEATLYPEQETKSAYVSLNQSLGGKASINADVLASSREFFAFYDVFFGADQTPGKADQLHGAVQLDYALPSSWNAAIVGQFGKEQDQYRSTLVNGKVDIEYETSGLEGRVDGALFELPGGSVRSALGALSRQETLKRDAVNSSLGNADSQRRVQSVYGEILVPIVGEENAVPLVKDLRFDIAARYDDYDDFGSTSNPKFAMVWALSDHVSVHGSYAKSFRAPTLYTLDTDIQYAAYFFPVPDPRSPAGTSTILLLDGSNPDLTAERARSFNLGLTFSSGVDDQFRSDISYFSIDYDNRITRLINEGFFTNVIQQAPLMGALINLNPTLEDINQVLNLSGRQVLDYTNGACVVGQTPGCVVDPTAVAAIANIGTVNVGSSRVRGLDGTIRYKNDTSWGTASLDLSASYLLTYDNQLLPASSEFRVVNTIYNPLRLRAKVDFGLSGQRWSTNARVNYANSYRNSNDASCAAPGCSVDSWTTVDLSASFMPSGDRSSFMDGVRFSVDVSNVFDTDPPFASQFLGLNYDPANASPLGRAVSLTVNKRWGNR